MKDLYVVWEIIGNNVTLKEFDGEKTFSAKTKLNFFAGDIVYFNEEVQDFLLVDGLIPLLCKQTMSNLTKNGELSYSDLSEEEKMAFDEAWRKWKDAYENPILLDLEDTITFIATRESLEGLHEVE